jgi:peptidoglycan-associated lipoprotein
MKNPTPPSPPLLLALALAAALGACESPTPLGGDAAKAPVESRSPVPLAGTKPGTPAAATAAATPQSKVATVDLASKPAATPGAGNAAPTLPAQRVVYFDFDSFAIKDDFKPLLDGYSRALAANRAQHLVVEGHTDERGGREYNLALGQKRAEAVVHSLTLLGAGPGQLEAVSFGEERPAAQGNDESAWAKNRRAELKDR